jgi:hypothetical protein
MALTLHALHTAMPSLSTTAAMTEQPQAERAGALLGLARNIRSPGAKECRRGPPFRSASASAVRLPLCKYPPEKLGALDCEPLKAVGGSLTRPLELGAT